MVAVLTSAIARLFGVELSGVMCNAQASAAKMSSLTQNA